MRCLETSRRVERQKSEEGFILVGLIVAIFLVLLALSVAAPKIAQDLKRDREVEAVRRGDQYVRAVRLYYRKFHTYPGSIEQLEKTNNIRFLRQHYIDPMTGKDDWRLIHVGEAKTTVKGFFGQPLAGLTPGLGSAAGMASSGGIGTGATGSGQQAGSGSAFGGSAYGGSSPGRGRARWFDVAYAWRIKFEWDAYVGWRDWFERDAYAGWRDWFERTLRSGGAG